MTRVLGNLFLILTIIVQCSPMRVCEWSALVAGHDCHDAQGVIEGGAGDGIHDGTGRASGDERGCVCNAPKGMEEHGGGVSVAPDLAPFSAGPVVLLSPRAVMGDAGLVGGDAVPVGPDLPQHMPLLI